MERSVRVAARCRRWLRPNGDCGRKGIVYRFCKTGLNRELILGGRAGAPVEAIHWEWVWRLWTIPTRAGPEARTWAGRAPAHGCGATWLTGTYDAGTDTLVWPAGNPCPDFNGDQRMGDSFSTGSVLAWIPVRDDSNGTTKSRRMTYMLDGRQYIAVAAGSSIVAFGLPR